MFPRANLKTLRTRTWFLGLMLALFLFFQLTPCSCWRRRRRTRPPPPPPSHCPCDSSPPECQTAVKVGNRWISTSVKNCRALCKPPCRLTISCKLDSEEGIWRYYKCK